MIDIARLDVDSPPHPNISAFEWICICVHALPPPHPPFESQGSGTLSMATVSLTLEFVLFQTNRGSNAASFTLPRPYSPPNHYEQYCYVASFLPQPLHYPFSLYLGFCITRLYTRTLSVILSFFLSRSLRPCTKPQITCGDGATFDFLTYWNTLF